MKKSNKQVVKEVNKMFPPVNSEYPICFIREGETMVIVSGECEAFETIGDEKFEIMVCDYYDQYRNTGGVHPILFKYATELGGYWEWETAGSLVLVRD